MRPTSPLPEADHQADYYHSKTEHELVRQQQPLGQIVIDPLSTATDNRHPVIPADEAALEDTLAVEAKSSAGQQTLRRRVLDLAWPVIGENFLETLLGVVDTFLVGFLGAAAIAGVGSALQILFFMISALSALSVGSTVLVAQAVGAKNYQRAGELARQSLIWSVLLSIPLALVGVYLSGPIIDLFGLDPEVTRIGVDYLQVTMGTGVVLTLLLIGGGVLRGAGDSRTPMVVTAIANLVNVGLSYALIFGAVGLPAMGAVGSAWATFLSRALALTMIVVVLWRGRNGVSIRKRRAWYPDFDSAKRLLSIGVPAAVEQVSISVAFVVLVMVVARLGTLTLAAHRIALNALAISFLPGLGFGIAATALVGQSIGARRPDEAAAATRIATWWGLLWMSAIGLIVLFLAAPIMQLFSDNPEVVAIGAAGLRVVAAAQPFWAILFVQAGALRGTGNTRFPLWVNSIGIWAAVGLTYLLIQLIGGGLASVWGAFLAVSPLMAGLLWWRFRRTIVRATPSEGLRVR